MLEFMASSDRRIPSDGTSSWLSKPECWAPGAQACCSYRPSKSCSAAMPEVILQQAAGSLFYVVFEQEHGCATVCEGLSK